VYRLAYNGDVVAFKMGRRQGGPSRTGGKEGAYLNRYVTDEQRSRRLIFNATLRTAAGWLFFRVARSLRINLNMLVARALKKQPTDLRRRHHYMRDGTLEGPGNTTEESAARAELRCKHSNSGSGAYLIAHIKKVHDIKS